MRLPLVAALLLAACTPKFEARGTLAVDSQPFTPASCRVLAPRATGIELTDANGARVSLELPPQTLKASEELSGSPTAVLSVPGQADRQLGSCGHLSLTGEGYHGEGKRAAKGKASLDCAPLKGELSFSGCF